MIFRPKFRIVEGCSTTEYDDIYEDFKADYLSVNITVNEMLEKYGISNNTYKHLRNRVAEETGVNRKMSKVRFLNEWDFFSRYIDYMKKSDKYRVSKDVRGKQTHFGLYDDMDTAVYVRDKLEENDWSQETYKELKDELFGKVDERDKFDRIYEDFKKDYVNGESRRYLLLKYHLGAKLYNALSKKVRSETGLVRKPQLHHKQMWKNERDLYKQLL